VLLWKVIESATATGFRLDRSSEINSNPLDTKDHPGGVWNLLPKLRDVAKNEKSNYRAICCLGNELTVG